MFVNTIPTTLYQYLDNFFRVGVDPSSRNFSLGTARRGADAGMSLSEYMTGGKPEVRRQEALYPYLRDRFPATVREKFHNGTFIDFWIPDVEGQNVAIEIKLTASILVHSCACCSRS